MFQDSSINELIRRRIKELRKSRRLTLRRLATLAGISPSAYASMEAGNYKISLDNLHRILGAMEVDILEVWPVETVGAKAQQGRGYLRRIQETRLSEILRLAGAEGGALLSVHQGIARVHLRHDVGDFLVDRLAFYLSDGRMPPEGVWFRYEKGDTTFYLILKSKEYPAFLRPLINQYLILWSLFFRN